MTCTTSSSLGGRSDPNPRMTPPDVSLPAVSRPPYVGFGSSPAQVSL